MYSGTFVFSQVMDHLPIRVFRKCVRRYGGNRYVKSFPCLSQFLCMAFAQLTHRESLRDIEIGLRAHAGKLYHMGIRGKVSRNTLANANRRRDWRIYAEFAQELIRIARPLHADDDLGLQLDDTVFALDASTIDLCLSVFPWALFRSTKSARPASARERSPTGNLAPLPAGWTCPDADKSAGPASRVCVRTTSPVSSASGSWTCRTTD